MSTWEKSDGNDGVVEFPSGRRVRGRSWHQPVDEYADISVVLTTATPEEFAARNTVAMAPEVILISWPDYRVPRRPQQAYSQLRTVFERAREERVEITCGGGVGRTGTALAMLAMIDGMDPEAAITFVQEKYNPESATSHAQRGFLMEAVPRQPADWVDSPDRA